MYIETVRRNLTPLVILKDSPLVVYLHKMANLWKLGLNWSSKYTLVSFRMRYGALPMVARIDLRKASSQYSALPTVARIDLRKTSWQYSALPMVAIIDLRKTSRQYSALPKVLEPRLGKPPILHDWTTFK